jgi:arylsulfatase A-like enzyme
MVKDFQRRYEYSKRPIAPILRELSGTKSGHIASRSTRRKTPRTVGEVVAHYDASIRYTDSNIGRLYDCLEEAGILDETLIVMTSDHGESLTEHEIFFNHHGLYDPQVRVPLIVCGPQFRTGEVNQELVQHFDIAPTLLEFAGIDDGGIGFDGRSLGGLVQGGNWDRRYVFAEETLLQQKRMIRDQRCKYIRALNDDKCLYCQKYHSRGDEFYDLQSDPQEVVNRIDDPRRATYKDELQRYIDTLAKPREGQRVAFEDEDEINKRLRALGYL